MRRLLCTGILAFFYCTAAKSQTVDPFEMTQDYIQNYGCQIDPTQRKVVYLSHRDNYNQDSERVISSEKRNAPYLLKKKYNGTWYKLYAVLRANKKSMGEHIGEYDHVFHIDEHDREGWSTYNQFLRINWVKHPFEKFYIDSKTICALFYEKS